MYRAPGLLCLRVRKHNVRLIPVAMGTTKHEDTLLTPVKTVTNMHKNTGL